MKKYLKGFSGLTIFPIVEDTLESYKVGTGVKIPYVQTLSKDLDSAEETIYADDEVYDVDKTVNGVNFTLVLTELPDELKAKLEGGTYNQETGEYDVSTIDNSPEFACTYKGLLSNGNYKMFREYRSKVTKITSNLNTKGNGNREGVTIEGKFMGRTIDNKMETTKEAKQTSDLSWLNTIPSIPTPETLGELTVESAAGTTTGKTAVTVSPAKEEGNSYKIKMAANPTLPEYDAVISGGYSNWDGETEIEATSGQKIVVVEVDSNNKAKKAGMATIVVAE